MAREWPDAPGATQERIHLRSVAEWLLETSEDPPFIDLQSLPVAGLRSFEDPQTHETVYPTEILSESVRPVLVIDLDDTVWPHIPHLVEAVSDASGVRVTMEEFRRFGHTRQIPKWAERPEVMEVHDQIQRGEHPEFFPFVNIAYPEARSTIMAAERMGHEYCYLTARHPSLFDVTMRLLEKNRVPHNHNTGSVDGLTHPVPCRGQLYCANGVSDGIDSFKREAVGMWLKSLRENGWEGQMVVVDDLLKPFQDLVESGQVVGIALSGPLNEHKEPYVHEHRVPSWYSIGNLLGKVHSLAVSLDPSSVRRFDCGEGHMLEVDKSVVGTGAFTLDTIPPGAYRFVGVA